MATVEKNTLFQRKNGTDTEIIYPITKKENIVDLDDNLFPIKTFLVDYNMKYYKGEDEGSKNKLQKIIDYINNIANKDIRPIIYVEDDNDSGIFEPYMYYSNSIQSGNTSNKVIRFRSLQPKELEKSPSTVNTKAVGFMVTLGVAEFEIVYSKSSNEVVSVNADNIVTITNSGIDLPMLRTDNTANESDIIDGSNDTLRFTPTYDYQPATKKYVDDHVIVKNKSINSYTTLESVSTFEPFYCTRLETETGIEAADLDKLKYIHMGTEEVHGIGTSPKQILDVINENYYYARVYISSSWGSWYKVEIPVITETVVDNKISKMIENNISYNVNYGDTYALEYNSATGWYESTNGGIQSSTAISTIQFHQDVSSDELTIEYKVSSEANFDNLKVYINDVQYAEVSGSQEGTISQNFSNGDTVKFEYSKDSSSNNGNDKGYFRIVKNDIKSMIAQASGSGIQSTTLYESSYGTSGTVYLNDSVSNYEKLDIFWKNDFRTGAGCVSALPNSQFSVDVSNCDYDSDIQVGETYHENVVYSSSGTSITVSNYYTNMMVFDGSSSGDSRLTMMHRNSNDISIVKVVGYGTGSSSGDSGGSQGGRACFTADTKIAVKGGYKAISELVEGDKVYSLNENTGKIELKQIDRKVEHTAKKIYTINLGKDTAIKTTYSHPFYTTEEDIIEAQYISAGYHLKTKSNEEMQITSIKVENQPETVYEIRVKDNHNYFVGDKEVLVYNESVVLDDNKTIAE